MESSCALCGIRSKNGVKIKCIISSAVLQQSPLRSRNLRGTEKLHFSYDGVRVSYASYVSWKWVIYQNKTKQVTFLNFTDHLTESTLFRQNSMNFNQSVAIELRFSITQARFHLCLDYIIQRILMSTKNFLQSGKRCKPGCQLRLHWGRFETLKASSRNFVIFLAIQRCQALTRNTAPLKDKLITVVLSIFSVFHITPQTKCMWKYA